MKIKDGFVLEEVGGSYIAVALGECAENFRGFVKMNGTGVLLWNALARGVEDKEELITLLLNTYDVSREIAENDVNTLINKLSDAGFIE